MYSPSESCYQCGLPLPKKPLLENPSIKEASYCCYGCRLTSEITGEKGEEGEALWILLRLGISTFFAMNVMILSFTGYIYPFGEDTTFVINYIELALSTPIMFLLGLPILKSSAKGIINKALNMDTLIVIGTLSSFLLSLYSTIKGVGTVYFDTASMLLVLVTVGRLIEANAKAQSTKAIKGLLELSPKEATVIRNGKQERVVAESLKKEDIIKVIPGENFAVDGEVIEGESSVDESMLTGESKTVFKEKGSLVFSGTTNIDGLLMINATHVGEEVVLSRFLKILQDARKGRAPIERRADRISSIFIPVAIGISALTFIFWLSKSGIDSAIMNSLSVLLISCPCTLGIATPMAIWIALGRAAKEGILIRTGETLEKLSRIRRIFFDKTGTITQRSLILSTVFLDPSSEISESDLITFASSLESASDHPIAKGLNNFASKNGYSLIPTNDLKTYPGLGIQGKLNGTRIYIGNVRFCERNLIRRSECINSKLNELESKGMTVILCGWDKKVNGILGFSEELREGAVDTISKLRNFGLDILILTGDNKYSAMAVARILGVEVKSELNPEDKVEEIKSSKNGFSVMVGDGINDAPALNASDVGIALGCGMDLTRESADVSLLGDDLGKIPWVLKLAGKTLRKIKENLFWAFIYNIAGIGLAVSGILQPIWAAVVMMLSSLFVLANSLRLQKIKIT